MVLTPWRKNISEDGNAFIERLVRLGIPALQLTHELFGSDCTSCTSSICGVSSGSRGGTGLHYLVGQPGFTGFRTTGPRCRRFV